MADKKTAQTKTSPEAAKPAKKAPAKKAAAKPAKAFSADERAAMKERAAELKRAASRGPGAAKAAGEADVLAKIAEMPKAERAMAERLHALVKARTPTLSAKTWYGMPAYARDGEVVCFFQSAAKFKTRYATIAFSDKAHLDDGDMWATGFALTAWNATVEAKIGKLLEQATG